MLPNPSPRVLGQGRRHHLGAGWASAVAWRGSGCCSSLSQPPLTWRRSPGYILISGSLTAFAAAADGTNWDGLWALYCRLSQGQFSASPLWWWVFDDWCRPLSSYTSLAFLGTGLDLGRTPECFETSRLLNDRAAPAGTAANERRERLPDFVFIKAGGLPTIIRSWNSTTAVWPRNRPQRNRHRELRQKERAKVERILSRQSWSMLSHLLWSRAYRQSRHGRRRTCGVCQLRFLEI